MEGNAGEMKLPGKRTSIVGNGPAGKIEGRGRIDVGARRKDSQARS